MLTVTEAGLWVDRAFTVLPTFGYICEFSYQNVFKERQRISMERKRKRERRNYIWELKGERFGKLLCFVYTKLLFIRKMNFHFR